MSSHLNTPRTVLLADQPRTPVTVSAQHGQNRADRRHVPLDVKGKPIFKAGAATLTIPKAARRPASNVPHVKP